MVQLSNSVTFQGNYKYGSQESKKAYNGPKIGTSEEIMKNFPANRPQMELIQTKKDAVTLTSNTPNKAEEKGLVDTIKSHIDKRFNALEEKVNKFIGHQETKAPATEIKASAAEVKAEATKVEEPKVEELKAEASKTEAPKELKFETPEAFNGAAEDAGKKFDDLKPSLKALKEHGSLDKDAIKPGTDIADRVVKEFSETFDLVKKSEIKPEGMGKKKVALIAALTLGVGAIVGKVLFGGKSEAPAQQIKQA